VHESLLLLAHHRGRGDANRRTSTRSGAASVAIDLGQLSQAVLRSKQLRGAFPHGHYYNESRTQTGKQVNLFGCPQNVEERRVSSSRDPKLSFCT
jgi:hypothetical protein